MSETQAVIGLVGVLFVIVAVAFAVPGWLTNQPDSAQRMKYRFVSWLLAWAGFFAFFSSGGHYSWWANVLHVALVVWALSRCTHWYGQMEAWRKAEREYPRRVVQR